MTHTRLYREGKLTLEDFPVEDVSEHLQEEGACVWLDYCSPSRQDLETIAEELKLHPLAVEDAVNEHQRPKLDRYDSHLFISAYSVRLDTVSGELAASEVAVFVTRKALVTVRKDEGVAIDPVLARWDESKDLVEHGVSFLLWACSTTSWTAISKPCSPWIQRSRRSRISCSTMPHTTPKCSAAPSSCARASSCCDGSCCRCERSSIL